ncbi:hypothetical protein [Pseudorhodobacter sp. MZDSW-24AT]|uniref:hypothetical protein n=1 Tax=Pseudorhodobacter sp. MZDSW-24AT TaxID=2052957 RepID=UPI000C1EF87D|nr:hypothetical protein [Pseudorhodobacter sp. MZDSW-24AT]PJF08890.1 hypothetical protein CUR21_10425 [Pseudorhodobacter sp. MZDSW-24AT]
MERLDVQIRSMTIGAPDTVPTTELPEHDDLDLGFDALIRRYATHRLADPAALSRLRPDLTPLIAPPEVVFAAYLADGSIVLCCPEGVPLELSGVVHVLSPLREPPLPVRQIEIPHVLTKLDEISLRLDQFQRAQGDGADIVARLEDVKTALISGLRRAEAAATSGPPASSLLEQVRHHFTDFEERLLVHLNQTQTVQSLGLQIAQIDHGVHRLLAQAPDQAKILEKMVQLNQDIADIGSGRISQIELLQARQELAQFFEALNTGLRRLDNTVDRLETPSADPRLDEIHAQLATFGAQIDGSRKAAIAIEALSRTVGALQSSMDTACRLIASTPEALVRVSDQLQALAQRPDPVLDLTAQRQSFAQFATVLHHIVERIESAVQTVENDQGGVQFLEALHGLRKDLEAPLSRLPEALDAISDLSWQLKEAVDRPPPVPDLTLHRQSVAQIAIALRAGLQRLEDRTEGIHDAARNVQDMTVQAIFALLASQLKTGAAPETQRLALAEALASALAGVGWTPASVK